MPHLHYCLATTILFFLSIIAAQDLRNGQAIKCRGDPNRKRVYRYTKGKRRPYRNVAVANAWDRKWRQFRLVFCEKIPRGQPITTGPKPKLREGQAIKCRGDPNRKRVYRYTKGRKNTCD